jgi:uncharacterized protein
MSPASLADNFKEGVLIKKIIIKAGQIRAEAELNDTITAAAVWAALPIEGRAEFWGEEIFFAIPVKMDLENGQEIVQVGDIGYWPPGSAFCIFFGETPVSSKSEIRPASAVTVVGRVKGDATVFEKVILGARVLVSRGAA